MRRCFTLIELLVAVAMLVVLLAIVSRIFQAAGAVTAVGMATADILAQAAAIERAIRSDFERLSREGFLAIRCVAVPNNVNLPGPLLAPWLAPDAVIRADQIVFFTHGVVTLSTFRGTAGLNRKGSSTAASTTRSNGRRWSTATIEASASGCRSGAARRIARD